MKHQGTNENSLKIGTFNVRGLKSDLKKTALATDVNKFKLTAAAIQETHLTGNGLIEITSKEGKSFELYYGGGNDKGEGGVGIIVRKGIKVEFQEFTDRICAITTHLDERKLMLINAYAPTLPKSENNPEIREKFYKDLDSIINTVSKRTILLIAGDFNAKTGSGWKTHPENIGYFGKGLVNSNGEHLLDLANRQNLVLTNTIFDHKKAHRTTWEAPERTFENRTNPIRNQIDYILARKEHRIFIQDSRSYSGTETFSDHRMVILKMKINWKIITPRTTSKKQIDIQKLQDPEIRKKYSEEIKKSLHQNETSQNAQDKWNTIVEACKEASVKTLGYARKKKTKKAVEDEEVKKLSSEQKEIRMKINATRNQETRKTLQIQRNQKMKEIQRKIQEIEDKKILEDIEELENCKDDSNKMFKAIRKTMRRKPKEAILVETQEGLTANEETAVEKVTEFFKQTFNAENQCEMEKIKPTEMKDPFTSEEIGKAIRSLKNNKSAGIDDITAEQLKYGPKELNQGIADILNSTAKTGIHPKELKDGVLIPIPKPNKKKGPPGNLRPIILLSMIRKILAICMIRRTYERLTNNTPITQAAYKSGRSTTELIFAVKLLAEKAITSASYSITVLLLDMSKAFDTVDRGQLYQDLKKILEPDELHMISILLKDVTLQVRIGQKTGNKFTTNVGVPQGDCLSPVLFTIYLAKAMKEENNNDHTYTSNRRVENFIPPEIQDHLYCKPPKEFPLLIDQQYADDIGWISTAKHITDRIKENIPKKLKERNLQVNEGKTEEYTIKRGGGEEWRTCKYVGSLIDTYEDIKRRKKLAMAALNQHRHSLLSNKIRLKTRIRILNAYITSIFMYNSEVWTLTKKLEKEIDTFQRNILRKMLHIKWPYTISNINLYRRTKEKEWSKKIKIRRMRWLGHLLRLDENTPARQALEESLKRARRPQGQPKTTWIKKINEDLKSIREDLKLESQELVQLAADRVAWRAMTSGSAVPTNGEEAY